MDVILVVIVPYYPLKRRRKLYAYVICVCLFIYVPLIYNNMINKYTYNRENTTIIITRHRIFCLSVTRLWKPATFLVCKAPTRLQVQLNLRQVYKHEYYNSIINDKEHLFERKWSLLLNSFNYNAS